MCVCGFFYLRAKCTVPGAKKREDSSSPNGPLICALGFFVSSPNDEDVAPVLKTTWLHLGKGIFEEVAKPRVAPHAVKLSSKYNGRWDTLYTEEASPDTEKDREVAVFQPAREV